MVDLESNLVRPPWDNFVLSDDPGWIGTLWRAPRLYFDDNPVPRNWPAILRVLGDASRGGQQERRVGGGSREPDHLSNDVPLWNLLPGLSDADAPAEHCSRVAVFVLACWA